MKRRILSICLTLIMSISLITNINLQQSEQFDGGVALAEFGDNEAPFDTPYNGVYGVLKYEATVDGTIVITGCTDNDVVEIEVPDYIDNKPVTEIRENAFKNLTSLSAIELPDTLRAVGAFAFSGCTSLLSVVFPENVTTVGRSCFDGCNNLEELVFLNADCNIVNIGSYSQIAGLIVGGYSDSTAEIFANAHDNITFVPIDLPLVPSVDYRTHVQTYGWETEWRSDGEVSGTSGEAKRLEAISIQLYDQPLAGNIEYRTHVQTYGWENTWSKNGEISGTSGEAKRLEAIQIRLTGKMGLKYDVYYRVHAETFGWLGWAKNGETAGTAGFAKRLEAIQILIVYRGFLESQDMELDSYLSYIDGTTPTKSIQYATHVQSYGWETTLRKDGEISGTSGEAKRLEAIIIDLCVEPEVGGVEYRTHVQTYGWEKTWRKDGEISGTSGEAKRLEAIQLRLTGELSKKYDIYYRVHAQSYGWLGWAKNGQSAGTEGFAKRLEAIQIVVVKKDQPAPGSTANAFVKK